ncbi:hypothetical protein E3N88_46236 [Mikania micrantha]|uniref:Uncharacterized protein n=1 Tax=Mikania micrantha TaxID=192012 RepID=A0A5N6L986_9ASTR|nr:hypothetical protein E3N88_46236 [Mikania micrantha]
MAESESKREASLKDQGNEFFKAGNYLKAAAIYTQAIKKDPSNPTLYSNRAAAFLNLVKLQKALIDAETTISLNPSWDKGYFRKGCVLEAMERFDDALDAFRIAAQHNPHKYRGVKKDQEAHTIVKREKTIRRSGQFEINIDLAKYLDGFKSELAQKHVNEEYWKNIFSFVVENNGDCC